MSGKKVPGWLTGLLVGGTFATLLWLGRRRPLRRSVEPKGWPVSWVSRGG